MKNTGFSLTLAKVLMNFTNNTNFTNAQIQSGCLWGSSFPGHEHAHERPVRLKLGIDHEAPAPARETGNMIKTWFKHETRNMKKTWFRHDWNMPWGQTENIIKTWFKHESRNMKTNTGKTWTKQAFYFSGFQGKPKTSKKHADISWARQKHSGEHGADHAVRGKHANKHGLRPLGDAHDSCLNHVLIMFLARNRAIWSIRI